VKGVNSLESITIAPMLHQGGAWQYIVFVAAIYKK
jgi:hypothetical protein